MSLQNGSLNSRLTQDSLAWPSWVHVLVTQTDLDLQLWQSPGGIPHTAVQTGSSRRSDCTLPPPITIICLRRPTEPNHQLGLRGITAIILTQGIIPQCPNPNKIPEAHLSVCSRTVCYQWGAVAMFMVNLSLLDLLVNNQSTAPQGCLLLKLIKAKLWTEAHNTDRSANHVSNNKYRHDFMPNS